VWAAGFMREKMRGGMAVCCVHVCHLKDGVNVHTREVSQGIKCCHFAWRKGEGRH